MSIEIGSKWVKDGEVVIVSDYFLHRNAFFVIEYKYINVERNGQCCLLTEVDFSKQYKPEPVYEYKYVIGSTEFQKITNKFYKSDEELMSSEDTHGFIGQSFQRLDFTKRERKQ